MLGGDLLRVGLVREVVVAGGEPFDGVEGELVLRRAPLVVERPRRQAESSEIAHELLQNRQTLVRKRGRDGGAAERRLPCLPVEEVELVLGLHPGRQAVLGGRVDLAAQHAARARLDRPSVRVVRVADHPGLPVDVRQDDERREIRLHGQVGEGQVFTEPRPGRDPAVVIPAVDVADESEAVLDERPEMVGRHGLASRHAVQVRRLEPDELDRMLLEQSLNDVTVGLADYSHVSTVSVSATQPNLMREVLQVWRRADRARCEETASATTVVR